MLYLLEATYTDKESQALRTNYQTETELVGAIETKLGQQMKDANCKAVLLIGFDHTGKILAQHFHSKDSEVSLSNRLVWIPVDSEGEHPNMQKYDSALEAEANYHIRRGAAMTDENVKAILTMLVTPTCAGMTEYWVRPIEIPEPEEPEEPEE